MSGAENNKFNLLNDYQSINQNSNSDHSPLISRFGEVSRRVSIVDDSEGKNASVPQTSTEIKKLTRRMSSNSTLTEEQVIVSCKEQDGYQQLHLRT